MVSIPPSTFRLPVCPYSYQKGLFPLTVCPYIAIYETDIYFFTLRTVRGRASGDGTWEHRETHWEKCDWNGYKELGAELSGFNQEGDAWWETWREVYKPGGGGEEQVPLASKTATPTPTTTTTSASSAARISGRGTKQVRSGTRSGGRSSSGLARPNGRWRRAGGRVSRRGGRSGGSRYGLARFPNPGRLFYL